MGDQQLCDDVLIEILLRVPVESVFRFKSVSKTWNHMLSHPSFINKYQTRLRKSSSSSPSPFPLLGFFQGSVCRRRNLPDQAIPRLSFLPTCKQGMPLKSRDFMDKLGFYVGSSNGLILCGRHPNSYYVCNPVTNQWFSLPGPNKELDVDSVVIGFSYQEFFDVNDGSIRRNYKVVRVHIRENHRIKYNTLPIETYSSDTGVWKESMLTGAAPFLLVPRWPCTVVRGIFYWQACKDIVAAYDPNTVEDQLWLIKLPRTTGHRFLVLGESPDGLLQCGMDDYPGFKIFVLNKKLHCYNYSSIISEWTAINIVYHSTPEIMYSREESAIEQYPNLIAFHPQNINIVYLRMGANIYWYDLQSGRIELIPYDGVTFPCCLYKLFPYFQPDWPPSPLPKRKFSVLAY
ncbi:hypothetical protein L1049_012203 [Liquidambar formosana]|uniref:F-box domain-containing protein n=1 Tax=Liquidambar formosana TaxID=63359 RepID=A0AAP0X0D2_LIQFO